MSTSTLNVLTPLDFAVVGVTLVATLGLGIYHGFSVKRYANTNQQNHTRLNDDDDDKTDELPEPVNDASLFGGRVVFEYFLAGRTMPLIPVAISSFATMFSAISVLGPPTEVYAFGLAFAWLALANLPAAFIVTEIFVPLFYKMRTVNIFKFLEVRYNRRTKEVIVIFLAFRSAMFCGAVIYGTAIAFNQVTNVNNWIFIGTIVGVCMVYTALGGIRGLIWTEVLQSILVLSTLIIVAVVGINHVGGLAQVWNSNLDTGRLDVFVFDFNLTTRHTFWSNVVGMGVFHVAYVVASQPNIQRFLTAPSLEVAKRGSYLGFVIQAIMILLTSSIGCIMYAAYRHCDPLTAKSILNMNQLVPKFVTDVLGPYLILPGLFFAGLLSACLSAISSVFNSLSAALMETFIQPRFPELSDKQTTNVCRLLAVFFGLLSTLCVLIAERFPNIAQASLSSSASVDGPFLGVLVVGFFLANARFKIVLTAFLGGILTTLWIVASVLIVDQPLKMKPMFTDGCGHNETMNLIGPNYTSIFQLSHSYVERSELAFMEPDSQWAKYFPFHDVTYQWLSPIGLIVFAILFLILSTIFGQWKDILPSSSPITSSSGISNDCMYEYEESRR